MCSAVFERTTRTETEKARRKPSPHNQNNLLISAPLTHTYSNTPSRSLLEVKSLRKKLKILSRLTHKWLPNSGGSEFTGVRERGRGGKHRSTHCTRVPVDDEGFPTRCVRELTVLN